MKYVIIGNGTAAVGAIEGIRSADKVGPITVISTEPYHVYGRPLISYMLLGKTTEKKMLQYRPDDFYEKNNVTTMLGGNRLMLRGIGLNDRELNILGIKHAGE